MRPWLCILTLLLLAGCSAPHRDPNTVVLWHALESQEEKTLQKIVHEFETSSGAHVEVLTVPFSQLQNKFMVAAPADQGPDLLIGPQDWLGVFATAQLLDPVPISPEDEADLAPVALAAETYGGKRYAFPLVADCLALLRNTRLMPQAPANLDDLYNQAVALNKNGVKGFYFDLQDFYYSFPIFSAYGGYLFAPGPDGPNPNELGLASPGGVEAAKYLQKLRSSGLIPLGAKNDFAKSNFLDGKVATTINGPWFLGDIRKSGVPYAIEPVPPTADGKPARPLVGVFGVMLNKRCQNREGGLKLLNWLGSSQSEQQLALASGRPPARKSTLALVSADPGIGKDIAAFAKAVEQGVPMPNLPAASAIWEPMKQALDLMSKGEVPPDVELQQTQVRIQAKIKMMME